ncbi:MAG: nucleotidyltransferase domain-containing protein [Candidatus Methylomirabilia bacterium]
MSTPIIQDLKGLRQRLAPHLSGALKAVAFGSVGRGEADQWSDLDLVIKALKALPGGTPSEMFTKTQAEQAVEYAREFIERAKALVARC